MEGVAATSLLTAATRARESLRPDRLFDDPWAGLLAGEEGEEFLARHDALAPPSPVFVVRHRFFDDWLLAAAAEGIRQVVLVAAGLDTRAYRLAWPTGTVVYEIDQPEVLAYKDRVLAEADALPKCSRVGVPADLRSDWPTRLRSAGFSEESTTVWLAEGLLFYLPEPSARTLLRTMASMSVPGSKLGTDTMSATMLASEERRPWVDLYAEADAPFVFGTDDPHDFVASCGWVPVVPALRDFGAKLGRPWPSPAQPGPPPGTVIVATLPTRP